MRRGSSGRRWGSSRRRSSPRATRRRSSRKCSPGQIRRKGYTTASGRRVKSACIKRQGSTAPRMRSSPKARPRGRCPSGQIRRSGFRRASGTRVRSTCIKDVGRPGRGKNLIEKKYKLRKGALSAIGYNVNDSQADRRAALRRAYESGRNSKVNLVGMLGSQATFRRNRRRGSPEYKLGQRFEADRDYVSGL